ncbi:MAG: glutaminase [Rhodospirillales bacterium]
MDEAVFHSEQQTGHATRAIAWLERHFGMIDDRIDEHLDLYFRQCAILVTARDLAVMAATLANAGVNPLTAEAVLDPACVRDVLSVMHSCGMYDYAGEWSFSVGLPAKSGVGGGIIATLPGQFGIGTFSPRLDERGNSYRGIRVCEDLSERFDLHVFAVHPPPAPVIHWHGRDAMTASAPEQEGRDRPGSAVAVYELQGDLYFAPMERLLRRVQSDFDGISCLILDGRRVGRIDAPARRLLDAAREMLAAAGKLLLLAGFPPAVAAALQTSGERPWPAEAVFADVGQALAGFGQREMAPAGDRQPIWPATEAEPVCPPAAAGLAGGNRAPCAVFTVAEARMLRGALPGQHLNLFLKDEEGSAVAGGGGRGAGGGPQGAAPPHRVRRRCLRQRSRCCAPSASNPAR